MDGSDPQFARFGSFDAAWRERALRGDAAAVGALADAALPPLFAFCLYRVGGDRHLCEEVVQETMVRAIAGLRSYEPGRARDNIFPWLAGLARNQIQRVLGRRGRKGERGGESLEGLWARVDRDLLAVYARIESDPFGEDLVAREETRQMVNATMSQLPPHYREALEAKYVQGRSVREMAEARRASEKAVESQLTRAREAFRGTFLALARNLEPGSSA